MTNKTTSPPAPTQPTFVGHVVSWREAAKYLRPIRQQVFIKEQNVPPELEWESADQYATHFLLTPAEQNDYSSAIGCARIVRETHSAQVSFHIGRVAIMAGSRRRGAGTWLLRELLRWCQQQADYTHPEQVFLHAQCEVIGFYQRVGFSVLGDVFLDAGIEHRTMLWHANQ